MKKSIYVLAIAAFFACNTKPKTETSTVATQPDTAGLHAFQEYKDAQRREQDRAMVDSMNAKSTASNFVSTTPAVNNNARERTVERSTSRTPSHTTTHRTTTHRSSGSSGRSYSSGSVASAPAPARKKGWSKAAKGTVIGAGSGAVLGAIVSKKKGKGAIIGGVLGAAGGYVIGHGKDKKDGRY